MDSDIRIPVTSEQKRLIREATSHEPEGMAAWARLVLMDAAKRRLAKTGKGGMARSDIAETS